MNKPILVNAAIGFTLFAILGFLIFQTSSVDFESDAEIVAALGRLKQIDAEWNVDVLRAKTGLNNSYDPVAGPLPLIQATEAALQEKTAAFWNGHADSATRIQPLLEKTRQIMDKKIELIERFKSQNSILRNSSRYLPTAADEAVASLDSVSEALKIQLDRQMDDVLNAALIYVNSPDNTAEEKVREEIEQLRRLLPRLPKETAARVAGLISHATTVVTQESIGDKLLAEISALPTARNIEELSQAHAEETAKLQVSQQRYRWALIAYSALLLIALGYAALRLYGSYRTLNKTNEQLNKTYEQLKESQVYLIQSEKMSALGQMVAGIAHEINTPLAYVKGTIEVLREQMAPLSELANHSNRFARMLRIPQTMRDRDTTNRQFHTFEQAAKQVVESQIMDDVDQLFKDGIHGIDQIAEIVRNLKNFSRLDRAKVSEFSVQEGLESTLLLANNLIKGRVEVRRKFNNVSKIYCSPSQINQVFLNIITNAVHAMPADRIEPGVITLRTGMENPETVRVEIQDNGAGIPDDVLPRIFDPFFTTKEIGKGTGMGLSISYKIIEEHGGRILVDTEPGVGTVFTILLPISPKNDEARTPAAVVSAR